MVGSIEPFIRGLYNAAPKCEECGDMREYWDDNLCVKCRKKKEYEKMTELKPCPCCGSTKIHVVAPDDGCYCWDCGLTMPNRSDWRDRWNRREKE